MANFVFRDSTNGLNIETGTGYQIFSEDFCFSQVAVSVYTEVEVAGIFSGIFFKDLYISVSLSLSNTYTVFLTKRNFITKPLNVVKSNVFIIPYSHWIH